MNSLFRGEVVSNNEFISKISILKETIESDLKNHLNHEIVINALHKLRHQINKDELLDKVIKAGIPKLAISDYIDQALETLNKEEVTKKVKRELGENPFTWIRYDNKEEKKVPLGVILHIGASNALGLSAMSVMEGLLTKNINILKLPQNDGGISLDILKLLVEIEPRLKPYIYVVDVSSKNEQTIKRLIEIVDGISIWGGDAAIEAIRNITPPTIKIIEWGHRLSFAYFTKHENSMNDLEELAVEIVKTDQLYCSSPQCVFLETDDLDELDDFAENLFLQIKVASKKYPPSERTLDVQSEITWTRELVKKEEILNKKRLYIDESYEYSVMVDYIPKLKPSPMFRNVWVMPIKREELFKILRNEKGHLQTVGLSCDKQDLDELSNILYKAGVNRIMKCGNMSSNYSGEPHDGEYALNRYVRIVNRII